MPRDSEQGEVVVELSNFLNVGEVFDDARKRSDLSDRDKQELDEQEQKLKEILPRIPQLYKPWIEIISQKPSEEQMRSMKSFGQSWVQGVKGVIGGRYNEGVPKRYYDGETHSWVDNLDVTAFDAGKLAGFIAKGLHRIVFKMGVDRNELEKYNKIFGDIFAKWHQETDDFDRLMKDVGFLFDEATDRYKKSE